MCSGSDKIRRFVGTALVCSEQFDVSYGPLIERGCSGTMSFDEQVRFEIPGELSSILEGLPLVYSGFCANGVALAPIMVLIGLDQGSRVRKPPPGAKNAHHSRAPKLGTCNPSRVKH